MPLYISSLNSGSNGNCYYIGNDQEAVLIDAGISCRETEKRMKRSGLSLEKVKAIFISHEHSDHISGLPVLSRKYQLPVYITAATQRLGNLELEKKLVRRFKADEPVGIGNLTITAFQKEHDASDPHSFVVSSSSVNIGVITDVGIACKKVIQHFKQCHAAFLEANYDEDMLMNGGYPYYLKKRISDGKGHLSNIQALELFKKHRAAFMSHLILSHLSKNNNKPEIVDTLFRQYAGSTNIIVASRHKETEVFSIDGVPAPIKLVRREKSEKPKQLSLF
ncbi:MAG TPA: MBL fold metallo-hydrolase [Chitinophagaceae bacterium]|nr:MBL fold metallo-hydrolase [Chitinophagaceae bacterium]